MDFTEAKSIFTVGIALFGIAGAWFAVKYGQADNTNRIKTQGRNLSKLEADTEEKIEKLEKNLGDRIANIGKGVDKNTDQIAHTDGQQWKKIDDLSQKLATLEGATNRHEAVLDPKMMGDYREKRARTEVEIEFLRRDTDKLMGRCDGNCAIKKV